MLCPARTIRWWWSPTRACATARICATWPPTSPVSFSRWPASTSSRSFPPVKRSVWSASCATETAMTNAPPTRYRILVVDDEPRMIRFIRLNLEHDGFEVVEAADGLAALKQVRDTLPDLVL